MGEENEETAFMAVFSFLQATSPQEILKAFHATLMIPLISPTYLVRAITRRGSTGHRQTHDERKLPSCRFVT